MKAEFVYDRGTVLSCVKAHMGLKQSELNEPVEGLHYLVEDRLPLSGLYRLLELKTQDKFYDPNFSQRAIYVDKETTENPKNYQKVGQIDANRGINQGTALLISHPELTEFYAT